MLTDYLNDETILFEENLPGWREAVEIVAAPLLGTGAIMSQWQVILWGSIMQGVYIVVYPALVQPFMRKVTAGDQVALGHTGNTGIALSGLVATLTRGKGTSKSTEDLNFPKGLGFLRDTTVVIALSMAVIYLIVGLFAGPTYI